MIDEDPLTQSDLEEDSVYSSDSDNLEVPDTFNHRLESHLDGSEHVHSFRKVLDPARVNPIITNMVRAATRMPSIERLALYLRTWSHSGMEVAYLAPGEGSRVQWEEEKRRWHVVIGGESKWRLTEDLEIAWKRVDPWDEAIIRIERY